MDKFRQLLESLVPLLNQINPVVGFILIFLVLCLVWLALSLKKSKEQEGEVSTLLAEQLAQIAEKQAQQQAELSGRLTQLGEGQMNTQAALNKTLEERLDTVAKRLGDGLQHQTEKTGETLAQVQARLAVIDQAQKNLAEMSEQMVGLQDILSNKQARGAFGEVQLQDLVTNALPPSAYQFQATLSGGKRPDCLLTLPNPPGSIVIDAKFPLDSYERLRNAKDDGAKLQASRDFSTDVRAHVKAIADKYIIPGETAESALMFLPSEAVYAELHANFRPVVEESFKRKVWIVSPTTLMATLNTVRAVLKDARMREQAGVIQKEVMTLLEDIGRLDSRVENLEKHFDQAARDIDQIKTSSKKIVSRADKIDAIQLGDETPEGDLEPPKPQAVIKQVSNDQG